MHGRSTKVGERLMELESTIYLNDGVYDLGDAEVMICMPDDSDPQQQRQLDFIERHMSTYVVGTVYEVEGLILISKEPTKLHDPIEGVTNKGMLAVMNIPANVHRLLFIFEND